METAIHCAYNVTQNVLLSERVWCVEESLAQADLLLPVMNGPGLDRGSGVWVKLVPGWIDLPRLFTFDFVYLDEQGTVVESGSAGPSAPFQPIGENVSGALILAGRRLAETGTVVGDHLEICERTELAAPDKAASRPEARELTRAPELYPGPETPFEVSQSTHFVFEPFPGSLLFMPKPDLAPPQSTEYFLPDAGQSLEEPASPVTAGEEIVAEIDDAVLMPVADEEAEPETASDGAVWEPEAQAWPVSATEVDTPGLTPEVQGPLEPVDLSDVFRSPAEPEPPVVEEPDIAFQAPKLVEAMPLQEVVPETPTRISDPERRYAKKPNRKKENLSLGERLQRWIEGDAALSGDRRDGDRVNLPGLVAFYWSGGAPKPHEIVNISKSGFYVRTKDIWLPDTLVSMMLQRPDATESAEESINVLARVVRVDQDGVGHEFVTTEALQSVRTRDVLPARGTNRKELERFLEQR